MIAFPFILNSLFNFVVGLLVARFLGAAEYGRYALALSVAVVLQTLALDWLRLAATRFYSEADRRERPEIRATLDTVFAGMAILVLLGALGVILSGCALPLSPGLVALAVGTAVANGTFEFSAALVRARFLNRTYGALVLTKTLLALTLCVGGAWCFGSATAVLAGLILSVGGSVALGRRVLIDQGTAPRLAERSLALRYAGYAMPVVLANVLYQAVPMTNRGLLSQMHGFAQAGQLALAFEMGIRILGAIGSALDVLLFQVAVLAEKTFGAQAGRTQVSRNMGIVFAIVAPAVAGCWLVLPSFERLLVPEAFRGSFARYFTLMLPALVCFALSNYCVGPAFQIARRTAPMIAGGVVAFAANILALVLLPASSDASAFAVAQSISSCAGLAVMVGFLFTLEPSWPRARDVAGTLLGTAAMVAVVLPLRALPPGASTLALEALAGTGVYAVVALVCDIGQVRRILDAKVKAPWSSRRARLGSASPGPARATDGTFP